MRVGRQRRAARDAARRFEDRERRHDERAAPYDQRDEIVVDGSIVRQMHQRVGPCLQRIARAGHRPDVDHGQEPARVRRLDKRLQRG